MKGVTSIAPNTICTAIWQDYDFRYSNRVAMGIEDNVRSLIALKKIAKAPLPKDDKPPKKAAG